MDVYVVSGASGASPLVDTLGTVDICSEMH